MEANPDLGSLKAAWEAALQVPDQAGSLYDPVASWALAPGTLGGGHRLGQRLEFRQRFPFAGKRSLRAEAARARARASGADFYTLQQHLAAEVRRAFAEYAFLHRATEINREELRLVDQLRRIATLRYSTGEVGQQDPLRAAVEEARLEHERVVLQRRMTLVQALLNRLRGRRPDDVLAPPARLSDPRLSSRDLDSLIQEATEERPELDAASARVQAARHEVRLADREYAPDFTVFGGYNSLWDDRDLRPYIGVGLNIPVWRKHRAARLAQKAAEVHGAELAALSAADRIGFEVAATRARVVEAEHLLDLYQSTFLPLAEQSLAASRNGYETALNDFESLLAAATEYEQTRLRYERALADYHVARADLDRAVGRPVVRNPSWNLGGTNNAAIEQ
jgi:outer membrane protein TolC